ncbi:hypothetical protein GWK47_032277 [Chionoecetes opilio]|uniref:Uncharacterized protein n=1 Tax=Chionoecetes opilio TaxID=41210 RepID=A0A8J4Z0G7_CHIOP|nr:hypothetical protein GWK47_032277 [Chionoecetes opilio]
MEGQSLFSVKYKRSMKAKTLASSVAVDVAKDKTIDPALLFQRFLWCFKLLIVSLDEVMAMNFHHTHHPSLRQNISYANKQSTTDGSIKEQSSDDAVLKDVPEVEHNVLDGGYEEVAWKRCLQQSSVPACIHGMRYHFRGFWNRKKTRSTQGLKGDSVFNSCAKMFTTPKKNIAEIEDAGCKAMVACSGANLETICLQ